MHSMREHLISCEAAPHISDLLLGPDSLPDAHFVHDAKEVLWSILPVGILVYLSSRSSHGVEAATQAVLLTPDHKCSTRG